MGAHIRPEGWREWHPGGPGTHASERDPHTKLLTGDEAAQFTTKTFFDGWDPATP